MNRTQLCFVIVEMFTDQHRRCGGCVLLFSVLTSVNWFGLSPPGVALAAGNRAASAGRTDARSAVNRTAVPPLSTVPTDTLLVSPVSAAMHVAKEAASGRKRTQTIDGDAVEVKDKVKDIWMIGLFPLKGQWPGGLGQRPAIEMGLEDVNKDPDILRGYRLRMTTDDTEVSFLTLNLTSEHFSGVRSPAK